MDADKAFLDLLETKDEFTQGIQHQMDDVVHYLGLLDKSWVTQDILEKNLDVQKKHFELQDARMRYMETLVRYLNVARKDVDDV